jgi:hypothetical protein
VGVKGKNRLTTEATTSQSSACSRLRIVPRTHSRAAVNKVQSTEAATMPPSMMGARVASRSMSLRSAMAGGTTALGSGQAFGGVVHDRRNKKAKG